MKVTDEEKEQLILKKIERINKDSVYALELFETYYKDDPKENLEAWTKLDDIGKKDIVKEIVYKEDRAITNYAFKTHRLSPKKAFKLLKELKQQQLVEFGIRK